MNTTHHYVVLRLAADRLRGEIINVGIVLFSETAPPRAIMMATLNKLRALDADWNSERLHAWADNINTILQHYRAPAACLQALGRFGFCDPNAIGTFQASSETELAQQISDIKTTYVANRAAAPTLKKPRKTRLQSALREQFRRMQVMGESAEDVAAHLVVANMPVPECPGLKTDFLYKNGVYRLTQTLDYRISPDALPSKLTEACVKSTAAELAVRHYGANTARLAVVDIPDELLDATDTHIDLLLTQGFEVFHFGNPAQMASYYQRAAPRQADLAH
jgi:hypothetical protein